MLLNSPGLQWTHEWASTMLLRHLVKENKLELEPEDVDFICDLIVGNNDPYLGSSKEWMFDIINNKRNSIDVDKFDYIMRDTYMMNLSTGSFDH